jgi:predicted pyridoxine 5'-phosphate oxidase superfamily flavin-nucleotide-binding protein
MDASRLYHAGNRRLQDRFGSRALADRLEAVTLRRAFSDGDRAFIEAAGFFFLATADAAGRPDCSFKGGLPGFVRVTAPDELAFPDYDGNGMFKSLGNIAVNPAVGMLFIDMGEKPRRLRVNGTATVARDDPLIGGDGRGAAGGAGAGGGDLPELPALHPRAATARPSTPRAPASNRSSRPGRASTSSATWCRRGRRSGAGGGRDESGQ